MASYRMRPRFDVRLSISPKEGIERFKMHLEKEEALHKGQFRKRHVILRVKRPQRHLWSPFLDLEFVPDYTIDTEEHGAVVHGVIGPSPEVWTAFMAGYAGLIFLLFVASVLGYAQWSLNQLVWGWYALPVLLVLLLLWYGLSLFGQRMAVEQTEGLRDFFEQVLHDTILDVSESTLDNSLKPNTES